MLSGLKFFKMSTNTCAGDIVTTSLNSFNIANKSLSKTCSSDFCEDNVTNTSFKRTGQLNIDVIKAFEDNFKRNKNYHTH